MLLIQETSNAKLHDYFRMSLVLHHSTRSSTFISIAQMLYPLMYLLVGQLQIHKIATQKVITLDLQTTLAQLHRQLHRLQLMTMQPPLRPIIRHLPPLETPIQHVLLRQHCPQHRHKHVLHHVLKYILAIYPFWVCHRDGMAVFFPQTMYPHLIVSCPVIVITCGIITPMQTWKMAEILIKIMPMPLVHHAVIEVRLKKRKGIHNALNIFVHSMTNRIHTRFLHLIAMHIPKINASTLSKRFDFGIFIIRQTCQNLPRLFYPFIIYSPTKSKMGYVRTLKHMTPV